MSDACGANQMREPQASSKRLLRFTFDGRPIAAEPGQSVAAALWIAGIRSWRRTRLGGEPRGLFCGIGVCFDCLVAINGQGGQRACLVEVHDGDVVEPHPVINRESWSLEPPSLPVDQEPGADA